MNITAEPQGLVLNISAVEREIGLSKDVLRMWERRYGFPKPGRDGNGERQYSTADIGKLRAIKRLMDVGVRPGKIIGLPLAELNTMADARTAMRPDRVAPDVEHDVLRMLRTHDATGLQHVLANLMMRQGLQRFGLDTISPPHRAAAANPLPGPPPTTRPTSGAAPAPATPKAKPKKRPDTSPTRPGMRFCASSAVSSAASARSSAMARRPRKRTPARNTSSCRRMPPRPTSTMRVTAATNDSSRSSTTTAVTRRSVESTLHSERRRRRCAFCTIG